MRTLALSVVYRNAQHRRPPTVRDQERLWTNLPSSDRYVSSSRTHCSDTASEKTASLMSAPLATVRLNRDDSLLWERSSTPVTESSDFSFGEI